MHKIDIFFNVCLANLSIDYTRKSMYNYNCQGGNPKAKKQPPGEADGGKEHPMKFLDGKWWYKGQSFDTLHEALKSVWPK